MWQQLKCVELLLALPETMNIPKCLTRSQEAHHKENRLASLLPVQQPWINYIETLPWLMITSASQMSFINSPRMLCFPLLSVFVRRLPSTILDWFSWTFLWFPIGLRSSSGNITKNPHLLPLGKLHLGQNSTNILLICTTCMRCQNLIRNQNMTFKDQGQNRQFIKNYYMSKFPRQNSSAEVSFILFLPCEIITKFNGANFLKK